MPPRVIEYFLILNDMRCNTEQQTTFGPFDTPEVARSFYDNEKVDPWQDKGDCAFGLTAPGQKVYGKSFKKGGPLEWMNPLYDSELEKPGCFNHGFHTVVRGLNQIEPGLIPREEITI